MERIERKRVPVFVVLILFNLLTVLSLKAFIKFERIYGTDEKDYSTSVQQTMDKGYIISGYILSHEGSQIYLIKTDSLGDTLWTGNYGRGEAHWVEQTEDGGYIVAGGKDGKVCLIKVNSSGDTAWTRTYGDSSIPGISPDMGYSVQQTEDGGYIVAGFKVLVDGSYEDVYLIKTDSLGETLWTGTYGDEQHSEIGYSVYQTEDGGYIVAGNKIELQNLTGKSYLIRVDSLGDTLWTGTYDGSVLYSVQETEDGGYIAAGIKGADVFLMKVDSSGDTLWTRTYGGTQEDYGYSVYQTKDGGYIIGGQTKSYGSGSWDIYLIKTDSLGDVLWTRTYGGENEDRGGFVQQTEDGGYIIAGHTGSYGARITDIYLIKTDSLGYSGMKERNHEGLSYFNVKSSILDSKASIIYEIGKRSRVSIKIYDVQGRLKKILVNEYRDSGIYKVEWDGRDEYGKEVSPGVYFCTFEADGLKDTKRIIKLR